MKIIMVGTSYHHSTVEVREQVSFSSQTLEEAYQGLRHIEGVEEVLILDTCNRTEVYAYVSEACNTGIILDFLISFHKIGPDWRDRFYRLEGKEAVEHLYKVTTGLESMVVGEDQILGQVKGAHDKALEMGMTGKVFNTLFRYVITAAKKTRKNIMGNNPPLSISTIAINFIKQELVSLKDKKVFVLGVGKMSVINIQNLIEEGVEEIFVANRTKHSARQLAKFFPQIQVVPYEERLEVLSKCDIVVSSTSAPHYIVSKDMLMPFYKKRKMYFIDLSLPRDIDPSLANLEGIRIFTLDDLQQVSDDNMSKRQEQARKAAAALKEEEKEFWEWYRCQPIVPIISSLQDYYTEIADEEIQSLMGRLGHLSKRDKRLIETVTRSMARRLFNIPILQMKECAKNGESEVVSKVVEDLFELPAEKTIKVGTRGSTLALAQANWVVKELARQYPNYKFEICIIKTQGDIKKDVPLEIIGGKGVFVKYIQRALIDGTIDLAVHSMKDVPARLPQGSVMGAVPIRENPQDVLISVSGLPLEELPKGARVGTSSLRRRLLVQEMRPDLEILPIRGNVETRIEKMKNGEYDAIILAAAGINRIGGDLQKEITQYLPYETFIPAVGQAALGLEVRVGSLAEKVVKSIHHKESGYAVGAERAFLRKLNGNCKIPIAAHAKIKGDRLTISGVIAKDRESKLYYGKKEGLATDFEAIGGSLAEEIIAKAGISLDDWLTIQEERNQADD